MVSAQSAVPLSRVLTDLEDAEKQASEIVAGLSQTQANWQPNPQSWSIVQCLTHLARTNRVYAAAMYEAVQAATDANPSNDSPASVSLPWFGAWFVRSMEPPVRKRIRASKKVLPESQAQNPRETLAEFISSHQPVRGVIESASRVNVNQLRFKNPFIGVLRFTVGTGLLVINSHDRRHLWQADQLKKTPGFPQG